MTKKQKRQWQADMFVGFNEGWTIAVDPFGVLIQGIGMARKTDWDTIGGVNFWKKGSIAKWFGKSLPSVFMAWFVYTAWPTHWAWIVGFIVFAAFLDLISILWRAKYLFPEDEKTKTGQGPDSSMLEPGLSEPVTTEKPDDPNKMETLIRRGAQDEKYTAALIDHYENPTDNDVLRYMRFFEEGINVSEGEASAYRAAVHERVVIEEIF